MSKTAIIIGGGIAGCSSAYALASRGVQVTMLERNANIASEASGNPLAMLYPRLSGDDSMSQLALAGYLYSLKLFKTLDLSPADFHQCGMLQLGFNARELKRIQKVASQNYSSDILRLVTKQEASLIAGIEIEHDALYFPQAAWVNPQQLCKRLTQHHNISTMTAHEIAKISRRDNKWEVNTNNKVTFNADIVVVANANDAQALCTSLPLQTQAVRGQISVLNASEASIALKTIVCSDGYLSPVSYQQKSHCLGATFAKESSNNIQHQSLTVEETDHQSNLAKLQYMSPLLHTELNSRISSGRVALRCSSSDYLPLVGQLLDSVTLKTTPPRPSATAESLPWLSGLYMNLAHGSKGFTSAPLCAELLACLMNYQTLPISTEIAGLLNPNRFLLRQMGLKRLAKAADCE